MNKPTLWPGCKSMIGRADIEGSKSDVAKNAWPPQASYPCGNFSDTSCYKLAKIKRIDRPGFHRPHSYWEFGSSQHRPLCSTRDFRSRWAGLGTPALSFDRCTAPVKLPTWICPRLSEARERAPASSENNTSTPYIPRLRQAMLYLLTSTE